MRVMVVRPGPQFSVADVARGLVKGLVENGATVYDFPFDDMLEFYGSVALKKGRRWLAAFDAEGAAHQAGDRLQAACYRFWPDVLVLVSCFWIPDEVFRILRMRPHRIVLWLTESPYEDPAQLKIAPYADLVALNDPLNIGAFTDHARTAYFPHSYDPDVHRPGPGRDDWQCDVAFAGTGFPSRIEFMADVDWSGVDLRLGGMWKQATPEWPLLSRMVHPIDECMDNADTVTLYQSAKLGFNLYRQEHLDGGQAEGIAVGPREVEMAATGLPFLRDRRPEGDELFPMLPTFDCPDEFTDKMRWWLAHDAERYDAARRARAAVADRTFAATAARLLALTER